MSLSRKPRAICAVSVSAVVFNVMGRADIHPVYDQTPADYSTFARKITLRFASDGYRINGRQGPDVYNSLIGRPGGGIPWKLGRDRFALRSRLIFIGWADLQGQLSAIESP